MSKNALTPVIAVPVQAQAKGRRYHGDFAIIKMPAAYVATEIAMVLHAFKSLITKTYTSTW